MNVPFLDLKQQYLQVRQEMIKQATEVLDSQGFCNGPKVRELEAALGPYCGCEHAIGVSSGTDALLAALMALEIGPGDEVITTAFTFFATAGVIWRSGAKPVFVDIQRDTFNIDPKAVEAAVTDKTRAIIAVHLYGQTADMDELLAIAKKHSLAVIEDAAQAIGAEYKGQRACSMGDCGALSFYPTKNLGAAGDAGMVLTNDADLAARLTSIRNHGQGATYVHHYVGGNFRMDSLAAVGALVKLPHLDDWTARLRQIASIYNDRFAGIGDLVVPTVRSYNSPVWHQYVLRSGRRDELKAHLADKGVASGVYYPLCLHLQECFKSLGGKTGDLPEAEAAAAEVLALPIYPELSDEQVQCVCEAVTGFFD